MSFLKLREDRWLMPQEAAALRAEIERLRGVVRKAHLALTKSSLTADERVYDATAVLSRELNVGPSKEG